MVELEGGEGSRRRPTRQRRPRRQRLTRGRIEYATADHHGFAFTPPTLISVSKPPHAAVMALHDSFVLLDSDSLRASLLRFWRGVTAANAISICESV